VSARGRLLAVIAVALLASTLTLTAWADTPPPAASVAPPTSLGLRPTKSLDLAQESPSSGFGWKLGAVILFGAVGVWVWRKKAPTASVVDVPSLRILKRSSIGVRSELLVIEMDGQRLLLGVTPSSIQNLYIAPLPEDDTPVALPAPVEVQRPRSEVVRRTSSAKVPSRRPLVSSPEPVEEQARGLYAIAERK
jgi:flagellar biogenesis protein FliO